jgi:hypothetical protein
MEKNTKFENALVRMLQVHLQVTRVLPMKTIVLVVTPALQ